MKPALRRACIRVVTRCNLGCPQCFLRHVPRADDMTWEEFTRIVARCKDLDLVFNEWILTGGEPTLWPYLADAVTHIKEQHVAKRVRICTNAAKEGLDIAEYGPADEIDISIYGAMNWYNIRRLKKQGGRRVWPKWVVHVPSKVPARPLAEVLPARCSCATVAFKRDKVYPCSLAGQLDVNGCSLDEDFMAHLESLDTYNQSICATCFGNQKVREIVRVPFWALPLLALQQLAYIRRYVRNRWGCK